jgi:hypothetical protein
MICSCLAVSGDWHFMIHWFYSRVTSGLERNYLRDWAMMRVDYLEIYVSDVSKLLYKKMWC